MKNTYIYLTVFLIGSLLYGCALKNIIGKGRKATDPEAGITGIWTGTLPCADCTGINYRLTLREDGTFQEQAFYQGKSRSPQVQRGIWTYYTDSIVKLEKDIPGLNSFRYTGNELQLLNMDSQMPVVSFPEQYRLSKLLEQDGTDRNIDFSATGSEPFWHLKIDFEENMEFRNLFGDSIIAPLPKRDREDGNIKYIATNANGHIEVLIKDLPCADELSGKVRPYSVIIQLQDERGELEIYSGCGQYLGNWKMNGIWAVRYLNEKEILPEDFHNGLPVLEFHLKNNKIFGFGGCNRLNGNAHLTGQQLTFSSISATRMACPDLDFEQQLTTVMDDSTFKISFQDDEIIMKSEQDSIILQRLE